MRNYFSYSPLLIFRLTIILSLLFVLFLANDCFSQDYNERYDFFAKNAKTTYDKFWEDCNKRYTEFLREAWGWYVGNEPLPLPKEKVVPPRPYMGDNEGEKAEVKPVVTVPEGLEPQPVPVAPVRETPDDDTYFPFSFYGNDCRVRLPETERLKLTDLSPDAVADAWTALSSAEMNNAIRDCLETRIRYNLCDWAYLAFLDELGKKYCHDRNAATLLTAYLYCQSSYQMRLAMDNGHLVLLYASRHLIFDKSFFNVGTKRYYPYSDCGQSLQICDVTFDGEKPMSLLIPSEQLLGGELSQARDIASKRYDLNVQSRVPFNLIQFYNTYPTSVTDYNTMTRWAMYANTPLSQMTKDTLYPSLKESIGGYSELEAANKLLNWVQTGFEYEYDDKVWGYDRAFFAEETLYYPFADCEDRSILFSRLVRDLLGLDVALIYYPGHLATAVCFNEDIKGDAMLINGRRFIVCDPTYIGAPVGAQMPNLEYDKTQAIVLSR